MRHTERIIFSAMARAFFASAWADMVEDCPDSDSLSGLEITQVMPRRYDAAAWHAARTLQFDALRANNAPDLLALFRTARALAEKPITANEFGHYLAMESMGHGVGLFDYGINEPAFSVPYCEFGAHSLERDYIFKRKG